MMWVSIYLNENAKLMFMPFSTLDGKDPERKNYRLTWYGQVDAENLEDVFLIFNQDRPEDYKARCLSVGDIVGDETGLYYCDAIGWKLIKWKEK